MHSITLNSLHELRDRDDRHVRLIGLTIVCAPLWWILGFNLLIYHLAAVATFVALVVETSHRNQRIYVPSPAWLLLGVATTYGFSIAMHAGSHSSMRVVAAVNNMCYWIAGFMLVVTLANRFRPRHIPQFLQLFPTLGVANVLIAVIAVGIAGQGVHSLSLPTPLHRLTDILGHTALVENSVRVRLITPDWFSETATPRFNLYAPYPTAAGAFFMISLPMLVAWGVYRKRVKSVLFGLLFVGHIACLLMTLSRMSLAALIAGSVAVFVLQKRNVAIWCAALVLALVVAAPGIQYSAAALNSARQGSSTSRFGLYRESIAKLSDVDWLVGLGVRTYSEKQRMPLGSHSTYVSLLYRTGLTGLAMFVLFQILLLWRWIQLKPYASLVREHYLVWQALGVGYISMALWMLTEDIDVPQLLAFMYFCSIGTLEGLRSAIMVPSGRRHSSATF